MRYVIAFIVIVALSGCDRGENLIGDGTSSGAADSGAAQTPAQPGSETLKVTYSKADPYKPSQPAKKQAAPGSAAPDHAGHDMKEKPGMDMKNKPADAKKPSHEEHPSK